MCLAPSSRSSVLSLVSIVAISGCAPRAEREEPPAVDVYCDPAEAWWHKPQQELQDFIRDELSKAKCVKVVILSADLTPIGQAYEIRDRNSLNALRDGFEIVEGPLATSPSQEDQIARIEIAGDHMLRLELRGDYAAYGPWGADVPNRLTNDAHSIPWHPRGLDAPIDGWVYDTVWRRFRVAEPFRNQLAKAIDRPL